MITPLVLALALAAQDVDLAAHHPRASALYFECPDIPAALEAYSRAPAVVMLGDAAVGEAWEKLSRALGIDAQGALQSVLAALNVELSPAELATDEWLALARTARSFSFSIATHEATPGEARASLDALIATLASLDRIAEQVEKHAREHASPPVDLRALALPEELSLDPWGRAFVYQTLEDGSFRLSSLGRDGVAGGVGVDADLFHDSDLAPLLEAEFRRRLEVCAVAKFRSADHASAAAERLVDSAPPADEHATIASGWRRWSWKIEGESSPAWFAHKDELLVLGAGASNLEAFIARSADATQGLSFSGARATLESAGGAARGATIARGVFDSRALVGLEQLAESSSRDALSGLWSQFSGVHGAWRTQLDGARFLTDVAWTSSASESLFELMGAQPAPREAFADVPSDAVGFFAAHFDANEARARLASLLEGPSSESNADALSQYEREFDFNFDAQIVANLRGGVCAYLLPYTGLGLPQIGLVAALKDPAAFELGLRGLFKALESAQGERIRVRESKYRDAPQWTVSFSADGANPQLAAFLPTPTVSIVGGRMVVSLTSLRAKKEIKRLQGEPESPHPIAADAARFPSDAGFAGWMDWPATFNSVWSVARSALAMFGGQLSLPVDLPTLMTALPESASTFTRFFEPTTLTVRSLNGGFALRWESSFGPETLISEFALAAGGVRVGSRSTTAPATRAEVSEEAAPADEQRTKALEAMRSLSARIAVFRIDQARLPTSLAELSQPTTNYPRGFLEGLDVERDPWGAAYRFELASDGASFRLWSTGPDGVDADGRGDDLLAP